MLAITLFSGIIMLASAGDTIRGRVHTGAPVAPAAGSITCQNITSVVSARANHITPVLKGLRISGTGTSTGDLTGQVKFEITKPFVGRELDVALHVISDRGEFVARGKATTKRDATSTDSHRVTSDANVGNGKGAFAQSRGDINATGHADTHTRVLDLTITGVVCADWS